MRIVWRRIKHIYKSGCILLGIEHFLVMFPSALLVAALTSTPYGEPIFTLSSILMATGIGTLAFIFLTKSSIPFFLGPSFSYISFISYYVASISGIQDVPTIRATILWGYILSGWLLICLSLLYHFDIVKKTIDFLFPKIVMGPAISLIGLELANIAIDDSGLNGRDVHSKILAILTLILIIIASLTRRKFFKNTSVFVGVLFGCGIAAMMGMFNVSISAESKLLELPPVYYNQVLLLPPNILNLMISIIPSTIVVFTEGIGRITVLGGMQRRDNCLDDTMPERSLKSHSIANFIAILFSSTPIAIYAENLAIMNLNSIYLSQKNKGVRDEDRIVQNCYNTYSIYPYCIAGILSILVACFGWLQDLFTAIPLPVLGAMEFFIFALIASPGIQMLVDSKIDYNKISNQIITASVLLAGVSSLVIDYKMFSLKGMSLGLTIGVILNLLAHILARFGILNESLTLFEVLEACIDSYSSQVVLSVKGESFISANEIQGTVSELKEKICEKNIHELLQIAETIELSSPHSSKEIVIKNIYEQTMLVVSYPENLQRTYSNDYNNVIALDEHGKAQILLDSSISIYKLRELLTTTI